MLNLDVKCPSCGQEIGGTVPIAHEQLPNPGDIAMCLRCGDYSQYDERLKLRALTAKEYMALPEDTRRMLEKMRAAR